MQWDQYLGIGLRWLHILSAMALLGGTMFQLWGLKGAAAELPNETRTRLFEAIRRRWSKVVMLAILFLLVSGLVNALTPQIPGSMPYFRLAFERDQPELNLPRPQYDILLGVKILLALVIFFFASVLVGSRPGTARFRKNAARWLSVNLVLGIVLVGISGVMRSFHTGPNVDKVKTYIKTGATSDAIPFTPGEGK